MSLKTCTVCREPKPLSDYYASKRSADGKGYRCKLCDNKARKATLKRSVGTQNGYRRRHLQAVYGLTVEAYDAMLASQGNTCAICKTDNPYGHGNEPTRMKMSFAVDHCHETGTVRGLLCNTCNRGLGFFKDNPQLLLEAFKYICTNRS